MPALRPPCTRCPPPINMGITLADTGGSGASRARSGGPARSGTAARPGRRRLKAGRGRGRRACRNSKWSRRSAMPAVQSHPYACLPGAGAAFHTGAPCALAFARQERGRGGVARPREAAGRHGSVEMRMPCAPAAEKRAAPPPESRGRGKTQRKRAARAATLNAGTRIARKSSRGKAAAAGARSPRCVEGKGSRTGPHAPQAERPPPPAGEGGGPRGTHRAAVPPSARPQEAARLRVSGRQRRTRSSTCRLCCRRPSA